LEDVITLKLEISAGGIVRSSRTMGISTTESSGRDSTGSPSMRTSPFFVQRIGDRA